MKILQVRHNLGVAAKCSRSKIAGTKRPMVCCAGAVVAMALILALMNGTASGQSNEANAPVQVKTVQPQKVTLSRSTTQPGTLYAFHEAELYAKVSGYLKELYVDIGDKVKAGHVLATIDVPEMLKTLERQKAEGDRLDSEKALFAAGVEVAQARVLEAQAKIKQGEAQLVADKSEYARVEALVKKKAVTESIRDESYNRLLASEALLASQKASFSVAKAEVKAARASVDRAEAARQVAQKELEELQVFMGYATIRAPFDGTITERNVDPGDLVRNAQSSSRGAETALFRIAQVDKIRVQVAVPERDAVWVRVGDTARFTNRALPGMVLKGAVSRVAKSLAPNTRTMLVEFDLPNPEGRLLPGMFGEVTILREGRTDSLVLPAGCIRAGNGDGDYHVYVVDASGKVQHAPVTLGLDDGNQIEIVKGLSGTERVVTGMLGRLSPNQIVRVIN